VLNKDIDDLQRFILQDAPWNTMSPLWRKGAIQKLNGFDESAICWQDWEVHIRAILSDLKYWKSDDSLIDSFYRSNKAQTTNSISSNQNHLDQMVFRIRLFGNIFQTVSSIDQRKEIKTAFAVLFFRLFKELYHHRKYHELRNLFGILMKIKVFTSIELLLLRLICFPIENKNNERRKFKYSDL